MVDNKKGQTKAAGSGKKPALREKLTKAQLLSSMAENTGLTRKEVGSVLDELEAHIDRSLRKTGVGEFTLPGLMKITTVSKPARGARKNVPNPFRPGEVMDVAAKPASVQVKIRPLKKLKEYAAG